LQRIDGGSVSDPARRSFLGAVFACLFASIAVGADGAKRYRIGFLSPVGRGPRDEAFVAGLRELGYVEGRNLELAMRFADGQREKLRPLARELVSLGLDVLVVGSTIGARAAKQATTTVPIVFAGSSDPVAGGIVSNLARPGGNITGFSLAYGDGFAGKWLDLLKQAAPHLTRVAVIWSSSNPAASGYLDELRHAARALDISLQAHHAGNAAELEPAFASVGASNAEGLVVMPSPFAASRRRELVEFAADRRLPAVYFDESFVAAGGLMSYGPSIPDTYRRAAGHVDRILKGAKPGDLPVEQPTRFDLFINLKTARAQGLTIPASVLLRANRVIE
jgi:putative ABC transport system substrate-binding protein